MAGNDPDILAGTVRFYQRHLFVCTGQADWPAKIDIGGGFLQALAEAIATRESEMPSVVKLTACDEPPAGAGYDLLLFADGIRYYGVREADIAKFVQEQLVHSRNVAGLDHGLLTGTHVFVCVHQRRDPRCGACGPAVAERFQAELRARGLLDTVTVRRTSHVGGHQHAGNVLIYPGGTWYGRVTTDDVPRIIDQHIVAGRTVADLWRGEMGLTKPEQRERASAWQTGTEAV